MGQFGNQPDFASISQTLTNFPEKADQPSAVFIGELLNSGNPASITVRLVGDSSDTTFSGLSQGTFLPIMVTNVSNGTNIAADKIVLYR
jgi:hypothetical protein